LKILIYGLGYVGLTAAGCLTKEGHRVVGVEINEEKVREINSGASPISEPGLSELLVEALAQGRLKAMQHAADEVATADIALVCVGTPSAPDGSHNMSHIAEVSRQIAIAVGRNRREPLTVVYRSTIRPGSIDEIIAPVFRAILGEDFGSAVELVYNPEFLREASAIHDYFHPPKIVVGTADGQRCEKMDRLNENLSAPTFYSRYREAEITKFVDNTWHATKIAFANEIGRICLRLGIDPRKVHEIFVSDTKLNVSAYYMRPGGAFGGSCLPKDVRALQHLAGDIGASAGLVDSLIRSNEAHKHFIYDYCTRGLEPGAKVLLVGLAFKAKSDDLRESPNVDLAGKLIRSGFHVSVYDPGVQSERLLGQNLGYAYAHLPRLADILVSKDAAEGETYDLVIDANGQGKHLNFKTIRQIDVHALAFAPTAAGA
jgi:GDP-mannose 6-dehydrogenase